MGKFLSFAVILFLPFVLSAQNNSLCETSKIDSLLEISRQAALEINIESSFESAQEALSESEKIGYSSGKAKACFYLGHAMFYFGKYTNALEFLTLTEQVKQVEENPLLLAEICRIRGRLYGLIGLPNIAINEINRGFEHISNIKTKRNRDYLTCLSYDKLTNIYKTLNLADSVLFYIQKNKALLESMDEAFTFRIWINLYANLGDYYSNNKQYDLAALNFNQSLELAKKYEFPHTFNVYKYMGDMELEKSNPDSSLVYYFNALDGYTKTNQKNELPALYEKISFAYSQKGMVDLAQHYLNKGMWVENKLLKEKLSVSESVISLIVKKELEQKSIRMIYILRVISGCFFGLLAAGLGYYLWQLKRSSWYIKEKELEAIELKDKLNESFEEVLSLAKNNDPIFITRFQEVYPEFTQNFLQKHPNIVNSEFSFCALIFLNFSSKEIAQYTFIEHRSVQTKKSRLRKKLNVPSQVDLYHYLKSHA